MDESEVLIADCLLARFSAGAGRRCFVNEPRLVNCSTIWNIADCLGNLENQRILGEMLVDKAGVDTIISETVAADSCGGHLLNRALAAPPKPVNEKLKKGVDKGKKRW